MNFSLIRNFGHECSQRGHASDGGDDCFRALLGEAAWARLAGGIRRRFARLPAPGRPRVFRGRFDVVRRSRVGWVFAWACRAIGQPLPLRQGVRVPARVVVARATDGEGVEWRRHYAFAGRGERCSTVKRRATDDRGEDHGLLECVGRHFGMELALSEEAGALHFRSTRFFLAFGRRRLTWPLLLSPGRMHVLHESGSGEDFRFRLEVRHPLFGQTFLQDGRFRQMEG